MSPNDADLALEILRRDQFIQGEAVGACVIGEVMANNAPSVILKNSFGANRFFE